MHGDVGAVNAAAAPELLEDDVVRAATMDHAAYLEAVERRRDAEGLPVGFEKRVRDRRRGPVTPIAAKAQSSFGVS